MKEYKENVEKYADESLNKTMCANIKIFNAFVICDLILVAVLGVVFIISLRDIGKCKDFEAELIEDEQQSPETDS